MSFFDITDNFITQKDNNGGLAIHFTHVPTKKTTYFKAFITSWNDSFKQDWKPYQTIGRMDDIRIYSKTSRTLTFAIEIPSADVIEAARNFAAVQDLIQMTYPVFEEISITSNSNASTTSIPTSPNNAAQTSGENIVTSPAGASSTVSIMGSPPFFTVSFANWAQGSADASTNERGGLYGVIDNIKFTPDFSPESVGFYGSKVLGSNEEKNSLVPKTMKLNITMQVIHVDKLGFVFDNKNSVIVTRTETFPYSANKIYENTVAYDNSNRTSNNSIRLGGAFASFANDLNSFNKIGSISATDINASNNKIGSVKIRP